jgi:hypothetical protein
MSLEEKERSSRRTEVQCNYSSCLRAERAASVISATLEGFAQGHAAVPPDPKTQQARKRRLRSRRHGVGSRKVVLFLPESQMSLHPGSVTWDHRDGQVEATKGQLRGPWANISHFNTAFCCYFQLRIRSIQKGT